MLVLGLMGDHHAVALHEEPESRWGSGWYHDASAALIRDGRVIAAVEEERLTRWKHDGRFPQHAARYCLARAGVDIGDIDFFAFGETGGAPPLSDPTLTPEAVAQVLQSTLGAGPNVVSRVRLVRHHVAHAMCTFGQSGYDRALIFTPDGFGNEDAAIVARADEASLEILRSIPVRDSLGGFYQLILPFLGYHRHDEYKVMGLAPYGDAQRFRHIFDAMFELGPKGEYRLHNCNAPGAEIGLGKTQEIFEALGPRRAPEQPFQALHADLAAGMQAAFERIVRHVLGYFRESTGLTRLCLGGGCAQNSASNGALVSAGLFEEIFVHPSPTDAGNSIGAALEVFRCEGVKASSSPQIITNAWGPSIGEAQEIERTLTRWSGLVTFERPADFIATAAGLLADGAILGWAQGNVELGPRALGNRSILADPRPASHKDKINAVIKERESYRPFAPAILEEHLGEYFEASGSPPSLRFMAATLSVREDKRSLLGAVTHIDGSARVQTVSGRANPLLHALLEHFRVLTGIPILLNTSFNTRNEPIVCSVDDVVATLLTSGMERAIIGPFVVSKPSELEHRLATLVPSLMPMTALQQFTGTEPGSYVFQVRSSRASKPISPCCFRILSTAQPERSIERAITEVGVDPAHISERLDELHSLWADRWIRLLPRHG